MVQMKLANLFSDGAVFQRNKPVPVWGSTVPCKVVSAVFAGKTAHAVSGRDGGFRLYLPPVPAGGPYELVVSCPEDGSVTVRDILVGEVWLASGQSNMEFMMSGAPKQYAEFRKEIRNPETLRMFTVARSASGAVENEVSGSWRKALPEDAESFSAVALWFALNVRDRLGIPVGMISSSWGGTRVEAWTSWEMLMRCPDTAAHSASVDDFLSCEFDWEGFDLTKALNNTESLQSFLLKYSKCDTGISEFAKDWAVPAFDDSDWKTMPVPGNWIQEGVNDNGATWIRRKINLPPHWAGKTLEFHCGGVDKHDITFFNGVEIGRTGSGFENGFWNIPREYRIPADLVKAGENTIAVRGYSFIFDGGFVGDTDAFYVSLPGTDEKVFFSGECRAKAEYSIGQVLRTSSNAAFGPCDPNLPHILFDGMIAPVIPYAIRGAIWYQGETNAHNLEDSAAYAERLEAMIRDWRFRWGIGDFPFLMVELANYRASRVYDEKSTWALLRDSQYKAARSIPNAGVSHTTDIGEAEDIHPKDKRSVGNRLARIALAKVYHIPGIVPNGPEISSLRSENGFLRVRFSCAQGLRTKDGNAPAGFYIAGNDRVFYPADAVLDGEEIVLSSGKVVFPRFVRYSWADNPKGNLVNAENLPAAPFGADLFNPKQMEVSKWFV